MLHGFIENLITPTYLYPGKKKTFPNNFKWYFLYFDHRRKELPTLYGGKYFTVTAAPSPEFVEIFR
jgi:hypothetical protein